MITITAPVWRWQGDRGSWHFLTISGAAADELRFDSVGLRGGFGSIKVEVTLGDTVWRTSVFPSGDYWILPLKAAVRRRESLVEGDAVNISLALAGGDLG